MICCDPSMAYAFMCQLCCNDCFDIIQCFDDCVGCSDGWLSYVSMLKIYGVWYLSCLSFLDKKVFGSNNAPEMCKDTIPLLLLLSIFSFLLAAHSIDANGCTTKLNCLWTWCHVNTIWAMWDGQRRFKVSVICGSRQSHRCNGKSWDTPISTANMWI